MRFITLFGGLLCWTVVAASLNEKSPKNSKGDEIMPLSSDNSIQSVVPMRDGAIKGDSKEGDSKEGDSKEDDSMKDEPEDNKSVAIAPRKARPQSSSKASLGLGQLILLVGIPLSLIVLAVLFAYNSSESSLVDMMETEWNPIGAVNSLRGCQAWAHAYRQCNPDADGGCWVEAHRWCDPNGCYHWLCYLTKTGVSLCKWEKYNE